MSEVLIYIPGISRHTDKDTVVSRVLSHHIPGLVSSESCHRHGTFVYLWGSSCMAAQLIEAGSSLNGTQTFTLNYIDAID